MEHTGRYDDALLEHLTLDGWVCAVEKTTVPIKRANRGVVFYRFPFNV